MMPVADVERDYVSREEAEKAAREAYLRGRREQVEASWEADPALPSGDCIDFQCQEVGPGLKACPESMLRFPQPAKTIKNHLKI